MNEQVTTIRAWSLRSEEWNACLDHLAVAEAHVAQGELLLARQREMIADLSALGRDVTDAVDFLGILEGSQALHVEARERLGRLLGTSTHGKINAGE